MSPSAADIPRQLGVVCRSVEKRIARGGDAMPIILLSGRSCKGARTTSSPRNSVLLSSPERRLPTSRRRCRSSLKTLNQGRPKSPETSSTRLFRAAGLEFFWVPFSPVQAEETDRAHNVEHQLFELCGVQPLEREPRCRTAPRPLDGVCRVVNRGGYCDIRSPTGSSRACM